MTVATLTEVLQPALRDGYAVAGVVCLGWEDTRAYVEAAELEGVPVILQAGPGCRAHTPLPVLAHAAAASCEGEIGFVGYADGEASAGTDPKEACIFAKQTGIDAMAISVGNVHLQQQKSQGLDGSRILEIQQLTDVPLVIHGGSGVPAAQRKELAATTNICKFNIGTELRMAFGSALRQAVNTDPERFDRVAILKDTHQPVVDATRAVLQSMGSPL